MHYSCHVIALRRPEFLVCISESIINMIPPLVIRYRLKYGITAINLVFLSSTW